MKTNKKNDIGLSILLHAGFFVFIVLVGVLSKQKYNDFSYVEVNFGLNENLVQTRQFDEKVPEGEKVALKAKDALPKLTKNSAPNVAPASAPKEDALKMNAQKIKTEEKSSKQKPDDLKVQKQGDLSKKDYLARKEEMLRKTGDVAQKGQKNPDPNKKIGQKKSLDAIPRSPFETVKVDKAKASTAPTGDETGQSTNAFDIYKLYLRNQLRLHWNIPDVSSYPATLVAIVSFTVNEYGALNGKPKIVESSRNIAFDNMVIDAVAATFPVSNPPPKDLKPPQTFLAKYNSKDVR